MPYCPKCFSSNVEKQSHIAEKVVGFIGGALLYGVNQTAGHALMHAGMHGHKYKCNKCGHEFD